MFFAFKKEKEVIELIMQHVSKVEECLVTTRRAIEVYLTGDTSEAKALSHKVDNIETEADLITHTIRDKLYSGAYLPRIREDIHRLVESLDRVANAAETCSDFFLNQRPHIPESLKSLFLSAAQESLGIGAPLKDAVLCFLKGECPMEEIRHHSGAVGLKESAVDDIEWDLTKAIFTSPLEHSHKIHLKQCLNTIAEVSDRAEDAADQLELVTLKSVV